MFIRSSVPHPVGLLVDPIHLGLDVPAARPGGRGVASLPIAPVQPPERYADGGGGGGDRDHERGCDGNSHHLLNIQMN